MVSKLIDQQEQPRDVTIDYSEKNVCVRRDAGENSVWLYGRSSAGLMSIGVDDLQHLIDEDHGAEVVCHFCGEKYHFRRS